MKKADKRGKEGEEAWAEHTIPDSRITSTFFKPVEQDTTQGDIPSLPQDTPKDVTTSAPSLTV